LDKKLEAYYQKNRDQDAKAYKRDDGSWRPFNEVKGKVADSYFETTLRAIEKAYAAAIAPEEAPKAIIGDFAATLRFYPYVQKIEEQLRKQPGLVAELTTLSHQASSEYGLTAAQPLVDQWKMERSTYKISRSSTEDVLDRNEVFSLALNEWTKVRSPANGDITFFHLENKSSDVNKEALVEKVEQVQSLVADEAQRLLMVDLLKEMKAKNAISLEPVYQEG
jgi:hypothetical protein